LTPIVATETAAMAAKSRTERRSSHTVQGIWLDEEVGLVSVVEEPRDVAGKLEVLRLVVAHGDMRRSAW
jgi:hypothetical protein